MLHEQIIKLFLFCATLHAWSNQTDDALKTERLYMHPSSQGSTVCKSLHYQRDAFHSTLDKASYIAELPVQIFFFQNSFTLVDYSGQRIRSDQWSLWEYQSEVFSLEIVSESTAALPPASCSRSSCSLWHPGQSRSHWDADKAGQELRWSLSPKELKHTRL